MRRGSCCRIRLSAAGAAALPGPSPGIAHDITRAQLVQPRRPRAVLAVSPPRCESPEPNGYASAALRFVGDKGFRLAWRGCFLRGSLGCSSGAFRFRGRTWMTNPWDCCGDPFEARVLHFSVLRSGGTRIVHIGANMCTLARTCARGPKGILSSFTIVVIQTTMLLCATLSAKRASLDDEKLTRTILEIGG